MKYEEWSFGFNVLTFTNHWYNLWQGWTERCTHVTFERIPSERWKSKFHACQWRLSKLPLTVFTGSTEKTYHISGCCSGMILAILFLASLICLKNLLVPRLAQKDIFHFRSLWAYRLCFFFSFFFLKIFPMECASICACIVVPSQYCALPQFFIQTNIPDNDLQDADHSSLISILFLAIPKNWNCFSSVTIWQIKH